MEPSCFQCFGDVIPIADFRRNLAFDWKWHHHRQPTDLVVTVNPAKEPNTQNETLSDEGHLRRATSAPVRASALQAVTNRLTFLYRK